MTDEAFARHLFELWSDGDMPFARSPFQRLWIRAAALPTADAAIATLLAGIAADKDGVLPAIGGLPGDGFTPSVREQFARAFEERNTSDA